MSICGNRHMRHWFRDYGVVGLPRPTCVRCGAPNPAITEAERLEYEAYYAPRESRIKIRSNP
jgi:hypothetical protein